MSVVSLHSSETNVKLVKEHWLAAFMLDGADFIQSVTTTVEGFFLITNFPPGINGDVVDAYACMIITDVVVIAIIYGLYEVATDILIYCRTGEYALCLAVDLWTNLGLSFDNRFVVCASCFLSCNFCPAACDGSYATSQGCTLSIRLDLVQFLYS